MNKVLKKSLITSLLVMFILGVFQINTYKAFADTSSDFIINSNGELSGYKGKGGDVVIPNNVTKICQCAFYECESLTSITIPDSVSTIDDWSFYTCKNLTSIVVNSGNNQYLTDNGILFNKDKTKLVQYPMGKRNTSYTIPNSVVNIGNGAFQGCVSLNNIIIPDSVTTIGLDAFENCSTLNNVIIPNSVTSFNDAFQGCTSLTNIIISSSVTSIDNNAFGSCESLTSIVIPDGVTSIGNQAFAGCSSLASVNIPNSVISIGMDAFYHCNNLKDIIISNSVTSIGVEAFGECNNLTIYGESDSYAQTYAKANNIPFKNVVDKLYSDAYSLVAASVNSKSQKSINIARKAIDALNGTGAAWAIGQFSGQIDQVQQPILTKIIDAINNAQNSVKQADINSAKASIDSDLPTNWKNSYSSAVDVIQNKLIQNLISAHNKAVISKVQDDIDAENALIKDIETASDSSIVQWVDTNVKGHQGTI